MHVCVCARILMYTCMCNFMLTCMYVPIKTLMYCLVRGFQKCGSTPTQGILNDFYDASQN